ncbi:hypothetical protein BT96DRAFT_871267 [Gymnopus androsaceus JB14]|uniref:SH3 domain-containing protein n=1 Tax=Gymnopus androsaceus JB14 TaxID=1447944 RepID=A0A6A4IIT5_9AGAR|nr:hypothetical protein BT96DRAFT_871267 [Gymnopus androsaceus JB14]
MLFNQELIFHPFFLATTLVANASWLIAIVSQALAAAKSGHSAVATLWLAIFLQLIVNVGMVYSLFTSSIPLFRLQITVFAAMSVVLGALGIERNIFSGTGSRDAIAAAWIILSIIDILWILVVSSDRNSPVLQAFGEEARIRLSSTDLHSPISDQEGEPQIQAPTPDIPFENKEPVPNPRQSTKSDDTARPPLPYPPPFPPSTVVSKTSSNSARQSRLTVPTSIATHGSSDPSSNYSYSQKALALYDYSASTSEVDDSGEGELSFSKGDVLEVSRTMDRKWWPARKLNGQIGGKPDSPFVFVSLF